MAEHGLESPPDLPVAGLRSLSCPQCAGVVAARDGDEVLTCTACETRFLPTGGNGCARRVFPARVDRLEAVGRAVAWLAEQHETPNDIGKAAFVDARLLYVPLWEVRATVAGWEFGKRLRNRLGLVEEGEQEVAQLELVDEAVANGFMDERRLYEPATDLTALGIGRPHVTGRELALPFLPGELERGAAVLAVQGEPKDLEERATRAFLRPPTGTQQRETHLAVFGRRLTLFFYPLWSLHYRYRGRLYDVTVDGRSGAVHAGRAPAEATRPLARLLATMAAFALLLAVVVVLGQRLPQFRQPALLTGVLVVVSAWGTVFRFRLLREVDYRDPFSS